MTAVLLGLGSGLCWGTADFFGGLQSRSVPALAVAFWGQLSSAAALLGVLLILMATGEPPVLDAVAWGVGAGMFSGIGLLMFYRGLAAGAMSIVAPISGCGAGVPVIAAILMGEPPSPLAGLGIAAALAGIVLVSLPSANTPHPSGRPMPVLGLALGAALGFGMFFVLVNQGADRSSLAGGSPLWAVGGARVGSLLALLAVIAAAPRSATWPGRRFWPIALIGLLDTMANVLFTYASTEGNLGIVGVLGSLYPIATVALARMLLSERLSLTQAGGVGLALGGVAAMSAE